MSDEIKAYFDGSCLKNPGTCGSYGYLITNPWIEGYDIITGKRITNNIAEYFALHYLLKELELLQLSQVNIMGDSKLIINTVNRKWGFYKKKWNPHRKYDDLHHLAIECEKLLKKGKHKLKWIPREENHIADELASKAYHEMY